VAVRVTEPFTVEGAVTRTSNGDPAGLLLVELPEEPLPDPELEPEPELEPDPDPDPDPLLGVTQP